MCSYYQRSIYNVLKVFNNETPKSISEIYKTLNVRRAQYFVAGLPMLKVIQYLDKYGILDQSESGYLISESGIEWRDELSKIVPVSIPSN